ncbi:uncharacterized protein GVI51_C03795 [Nakaseomyces glabratus]|uniref:Alpha-1,3-mannosyltransferase MNT3 n=1 Tax=Candida glabrata (strain ATCC 2001 / BCRC 20586 / JCM 3761 / NBRC 0622 / NRRL Y-65 / CBS 138) TaxID=284593 RepID=Q6FWP4_CANGA|nr:uncharacterized protein CAGL0C04004g [Nakaseomyces glabratus]KAH7608689.1 putative Mannosyltransferase [Nakaseomyces glabratus]KAH7609564.1 putative Mannosyltransferase [Nakaseomyces glabratus]QHS64979.1 uncharacterized protein GVI51_C03795 [Nakaseomyces glabratus]CAG58256.1 unnamed protein product [Nakaseomyces glabratus]|eukprot:XP_445350.1 uncharacterized protein CAGL0C04004g [[Candida] glabrata]
MQPIMKFRLRRQSRKYVLIFLAACTLIFILYPTKQTFQEQHSTSDSRKKSTSSDYSLKLKQVFDKSPFSDLSKRIEIAEEEANSFSLLKLIPFLGNGKDARERKVLAHWAQANRKDQCPQLIKGLYATPDWSNNEIVAAHKKVRVDEINMQVSVERIRIYNYCFLEGGLDVTEVLKDAGLSSYDAFDFQSRMFIFLKQVTKTDAKYLYPIIQNLNTEEIISEPTTTKSPQDFNANFMANWRQLANGKGIAITVNPDDVEFMIRLFRVLKELGNTYPIQVIQKGGELTSPLIEQIKKTAIETNQAVSIVDLSPILDEKFAREQITSFHNKFFAAMFNTFEEVLLLDADVVPYVSLDEFFNLKGYKDTGLQFWRDRNRGSDTHKFCSNLGVYLEPSLEEHNLLGTELKFRINSLAKKKVRSSEERAFHRFFNELKVHNIDSGIIVLNKKQKLHSLIMGEIFYTNGRFGRCAYGDKEMFMMGAFATGADFIIDPRDAGIIGPIGYNIDQRVNFICSAQMGHLDENNRVLWSNGGLRFCKFPDFAKKDYTPKNQDYFIQKYQSYDNMARIYKTKVEITGFIIPEVEKNEWMQIPDCQSYMYCGLAKKVDTKALILKFEGEEKERLNRISDVWNNPI